MKRILFAVMLMASIAASAQEKVDTLDGSSREIEKMIAVYVKADPMTKQQGGKKWRSEHVGFTEWDNGQIGMGLMNPPHIFIGGRDFMGNHKPVNTCKVGVYTKDGDLVWLADKWRVMPGEGGTVLYFTGSANAINPQTGQKKKLSPSDILKMMKEDGCYVRFIADVYGDYYWETSATVSEP